MTAAPPPAPALPLRLLALKWVALGAAAAVLLPFWPALVLAVWMGTALRRWVRPFRRATGERQHAAAVLTVLTVVLIVAPLAALASVVASDALQLVERMLGSQEAQSFLRGLVAHNEPGSTPSLSELVTEHGARAWSVFRGVSSVAVKALLGIVVFIVTLYAVLADGPGLHAWLVRHAPLSSPVLARLGDAFHETGRGLFVGVLGAGFIQGVAAAVIFVALGVPRPIVLGALTIVASIVPNLGSALVWLPVAAGLAFTERHTAAIVLVVLGVGLIGTIDNVFRPLLSRRASLQLPAFMVLLSMLGGILLIGTWGFLAGPLVLRLAKEVLQLGTDGQGDLGGGVTAAAAATAPSAPSAPSAAG
ncbi:MAG TPA: AI-2E family transporter [Kofleriaceae bacterium]|nr:AI-2E family transporter [Kofleriaceae bacterium]